MSEIYQEILLFVVQKLSEQFRSKSGKRGPQEAEAHDEMAYFLLLACICYQVINCQSVSVKFRGQEGLWVVLQI